MPKAATGQGPSMPGWSGRGCPTTDTVAADPLATPGNPSFCRARHTYIRRRPEQTVLHQVVREHLETFLAETRLRGGGEGLPHFLERELGEFLTCGVIARGFARFRCSGCKREILVAFSCKGRGPSAGSGQASVRPGYFPWAELLARVFEVDILACPDCGGRLSLVATIEQRAVIEKILEHLGLPTELPGPAPARSPAWLPGYSD